MTKKLVFVHNANSGFASMMLDGLHKNFRPSTYQCQLCALTWGRVSMKKDWKEFTSSLPFEVDFLHKDQLPELYPDMKVELPTAFIDDGKQQTTIIDAKKFSEIASLEELMDIVRSKT